MRAVNRPFKLTLLATLALCPAAWVLALGEVGNAFTVETVSADRYSIRFRMPNPVWQADEAGTAFVGVIGVDRSSRQYPPAFVRTVELESGRWASIASLKEDHVAGPVTLPGDWLPADEDVLSVNIGRMGPRVLMRVEIRPFQADPDSGQWKMYESIDAVIEVGDTPPPRRAERAPPEMYAPLGEADIPCVVCPPSMSMGVSSGQGGQPSDFAPHRSVTNDLAWKITVSEPGLYRVTGEDLAVAGVPASYRDPALLSVTVRNQQIPLWFSGSGPMQDDDWLLFYGAAVDASYTTQNVYWLTVGNAPVSPTLIDAAPGVGLPVTSAWARVDYAPKNIYAPAYNPLNNSYDHWFAMEVSGGTTSNIAFATPHPVHTGQVHLAYSLHGVRENTSVNPDHRSILKVGGYQVVATNYNGPSRVVGEASAPAVYLGAGTTSVSVQQALLSGVSAVDAGAYVGSLSLCYERLLKTEDLPFYFSGPADPHTVQIRLVDLAATNLWVLDVSDPFAPKQYTNYGVLPDAGSTVLTFGNNEGGGRCFAVFSADAIQPVTDMELVRFRNLGDPDRQADYLVVAPHKFRAPVFRLLKHRYKNELSVQVATPDDVYNEFSYGIVDPVAFRQYFGYAYHHYQPGEPRYALLVGAGSEDPLNNLGHADPNLIPTPIGWAPFIRTALDQWFVMIDGDDPLPDMALGRIPASSAAEVDRAVNKIMAFETAPTNAWWRETAMLVADQYDNGLNINFKAHVNGNTRDHLLNGGFQAFNIGTAYRDDLTQSQVRQALQGAFHDGVHFIHYMGHGGVTQWSSPGVWNLTDTANTANSIYPIVAVFTCRSGAFHLPNVSALGEALLMSSAAASACVAPTGLSDQWHAESLADGFYQALAGDRMERLGDALTAGFLHLWSSYPSARELYFYTIFGDPAQQIWGGAQP